MAVVYEWDCEVVSTVDCDDFAEGDVIEHFHGETFKELQKLSAAHPPAAGQEHRFVLVRDDDEGRSWAYVVDGEFDGPFKDAYDRVVAKVPKSYVNHLARAQKAAT